MSALKKLIALLLLALFSTTAFAISNAQVFTYAAANYPSLFSGNPTSGQYQQYNYQYYPASKNYLAVDKTGMIHILGPHTGSVITPIGSVASLADTITAWEATQPRRQMGGSIQRDAHNLTATVTTLVDQGTGAGLYWPKGITTDGTNLYVADTYNHKILKIVIATGESTTLAGSGTYGYADGIGTAATFSDPYGITTDSVNLYVADTSNNKIRKIVIATGEVTTLAGSGALVNADGIGTTAQFYLPGGITTDGANLYVTDSGDGRIRKVVIGTGEVTTLAGSGAAGMADGTGTAASFTSPRGITTDGANLYVTDTYNHKIRKIEIITGAVTTLAGSGAAGAADGTGTAASFNFPFDITTDGINLYVADGYNGLIRKIVIATGEVTSLIGSDKGSVNGVGQAVVFTSPGITTDGTSLYVADRVNNNWIKNIFRKIQ
jgi:sugar lactone lactonase YvrE